MTTYNDIIEASIKKEMNLLGAPVALRQARKVDNLEIDDDGNITSIDGDGLEIFRDLLDSYEDASGPVVDSLISKELEEKFGEDLEKIELPDRIQSKL